MSEIHLKKQGVWQKTWHLSHMYYAKTKNTPHSKKPATSCDAAGFLSRHASG
jgi:hypothetical protein